MPIEFECDVCGKQYRVKESLAGRQVNCKKCEFPLSIPGGSGASEKYEDVEEYFEEGEDEFSSILDQAVSQSHSGQRLPGKTSATSKKKKKRKKRSKDKRGWIGLGYILKGFGYFLSVFSFLILASIGKQDGKVLISIIFWRLVFAGWIRSSIDEENRWITASAALTGSHMLMTVFAVFYQGDPEFLLDTLLTGICLALLLCVPGILSISAAVSFYSFTMFDSGAISQIERMQQQFMGILGASHITVLVGAAFLCLGGRLIRRCRA